MLILVCPPRDLKILSLQCYFKFLFWSPPMDNIVQDNCSVRPSHARYVILKIYENKAFTILSIGVLQKTKRVFFAKNGLISGDHFSQGPLILWSDWCSFCTSSMDAKLHYTNGWFQKHQASYWFARKETINRHKNVGLVLQQTIRKLVL